MVSACWLTNFVMLVNMAWHHKCGKFVVAENLAQHAVTCLIVWQLSDDIYDKWHEPLFASMHSVLKLA